MIGERLSQLLRQLMHQSLQSISLQKLQRLQRLGGLEHRVNPNPNHTLQHRECYYYPLHIGAQSWGQVSSELHHFLEGSVGNILGSMQCCCPLLLQLLVSIGFCIDIANIKSNHSL